MTRFLSILAIVAVSFTSAVVRAENPAQCAVRAAELLAPVVSSQAERDNQEARAIGLGFTGVILTLIGLDEGRFNRLHNPEAFRSSAYGMSSMFAAVLVMRNIHEDAIRSRDAIRTFRNSADYRCLCTELGRDRAEEFIINLSSGWELPQLINEYLTPAQRIELEAVTTAEYE